MKFFSFLCVVLFSAPSLGAAPYWELSATERLERPLREIFEFDSSAGSSVYLERIEDPLLREQCIHVYLHELESFYPKKEIVRSMRKVTIVGASQFNGQTQYGFYLTTKPQHLFLVCNLSDQNSIYTTRSSLHHELSSALLIGDIQRKKADGMHSFYTFDVESWIDNLPNGNLSTYSSSDFLAMKYTSHAEAKKILPPDYSEELFSLGFPETYSGTSGENDFNNIAELVFCGSYWWHDQNFPYDRILRKVELVKSFYRQIGIKIPGRRDCANL